MKIKSPSQHYFSQIPDVKIERSAFDRSHGYKTAFDAGYLIPVFVDEALPGDTFNVRLTAFARMATQIKPIMDNLYLDVFFFAVPNRLVWTNWVKMMGERVDPDDSIDYDVPEMEAPAVTGYAVGSLSDYLGIPTGIPGLKHSALYHRSYSLIFREWFRDQNLIDSPVVDTDDADSDPADYVLRRRAKRHDYFTSCLPWPQKGDAIELPLGDQAIVKTNATALWTGTNDPLLLRETDDTAPPDGKSLVTGGSGKIQTSAGDVGGAALYTYPSNLYADLSSATASTINELRQAFQVQRMLERDARGGTRYIELIRSHFGVVSPDARLQRPELLGSGSFPVNISPVAQTSKTDGTAYQGNLSAFAVCSGTAGFVKSFTEHTLLLGLACVRADLTYQQGLDRMFSRSTRYDFYWPSLAHLGEQAVLNKEIYAQADGNDDLVFGYQERFAEYRYKPSKITGIFRSTAASSLDVWHLAQEFGALPTLGETFIEENPPIDRVTAVGASPHFLYDSYIKMKCVRPMPVYSVPGLIDHL